MRRFLFIVLAAVMLGGCTQVEDDEKENKTYEEKLEEFNNEEIEDIDAVLTVTNTYDKALSLKIYYSYSEYEDVLYVSKTVEAESSVQIPIDKSKIRLNYESPTTIHYLWGRVNGDFVLDMVNGSTSENFDEINWGVSLGGGL